MNTNIERSSERATASSPPKAKRRWFAFSLRTLLIATALLSCVLGYFGNILLRVRHQRAVIAKIEAAGGKVYLDYEREQQLQRVKTPPGPAVVRWIVGDDAFASPVAVVTGSSFKEEDLSLLLELPTLLDVGLSGKQVTDRGMKTVAQLRRVNHLAISDTRVTSSGLKELANLSELRGMYFHHGDNHDEQLAGVRTLHELEILQLTRSSVSANGLSHLQSLRKLKRLDIIDAKQLTDEGLAHIEKLESLEFVRLMATSVSGDGLAHLTNLPHLETLVLWQSPVTDDGMLHIAKCNKLAHLNLLGTQISDRGVAHLTKLQNLRSLNLQHTATTDDCLHVLQTLKHLEHLIVGPTVSKEAARAFKQARPKCDVNYTGAQNQVEQILP